MDCTICRTMPPFLRPPRNTICEACYEAARNTISLINKLECDKTTDKANASLVLIPPQPLANLPTWVNSMKANEEELNEKINFLRGFVALFKEQTLTDIQIKPGNGGPSIPAHRSLLAARSVIFKNMLDSDGCKAPPNNTITLPELNHEELESLLEFLYSGSLPQNKLEEHIYSLTIAADKYEIPYLLKFCERHMLKSMDSSNALDILEISHVCSNKALGDAALNFIVDNLESIIYSTKYENFVHRNPHLAVQISRAFFIDAKNGTTGGA